MIDRDRRAKVLASLVFNGIDFVEVVNTAQTMLRVHFLNAVNVAVPQTGTPTITGGETIPTVAVLPVSPADWGWDDGHAVLMLRVTAPGDFSEYTLTIPSPVIDRFFDHVGFSFKANCPSDLDCETPPAPCPPPAGNPPPIDYLAKDFLSFRQALLDFSALRYPSWQERSEADFGVMFLEALSAIADELSYTQDRVAREATLLTATQRRSVVRHARLVDYEPAPAVAAGALSQQQVQQLGTAALQPLQLQFDVADGTTLIPHGLAVIAQGPDGTPVTFETGPGLRDRGTAPVPPANALWNRGAPTPIRGYWFDSSEQCLPAGATHMHVRGHCYNFQPGQMLLIETTLPNAGAPPVRQIVRLLPPGDPSGPWATEVCDALFPCPPSNTGPPYMTCPLSPPAAEEPAAVTRLAWQAADALTVARDLENTVVIGNIANATQGQTVTGETFLVGAAPAGTVDPPPTAIERTGPRPSPSQGVCSTPAVTRLYTLANAPLTWLPDPALDPLGWPLPEIMLSQTQLPATRASPVPWGWFRSLLLAGQFDNGFTIDPVAYRTIARNSDGSLQSEYDGDGGDTIRFGDSVFGADPDPGMLFSVTYRFGAGSNGNVAAGAISQLSKAAAQAGMTAVMNPLAAVNGDDPQTLQSVQRLAPQAFRAQQYRAVLASDYATAAETLRWVERAGTVFRWTGSWQTTFTTPEPVATEQIAIDDRIALITLLNRYRMAGTESYVPDPDYVSIDLQIELCALANAFAAGVKAAVIAALSPTGAGAATAFFAINRFVFGQPLERSALEAAIQAVPGVAGITCIHYRLRDATLNFVEMGDSVVVGASQIIRCDNDPSRPNNGSLAVTVRGGR
jgi:hypothetical protein